MNYLEDVYFANINATYNFGGYFSIGEGESWELDGGSFDQSKFYFISEGGCTITIGKEAIVAEAGDWLFIPAGAYHSYRNDSTRRFSKFWVHFNLYPDDSALKGRERVYKVRYKQGGRAHKLFSELAKISRSSDLSDKLRVKAILFELVGEYLRLAGPGVTVKSGRDDRIETVLRYINENLDAELTNELLAEKYFAHPNHFIRAFREKVGTTPAKYISNQRMEAAKRLIESTELSVSEIGERVGFKESAHFSRCFKERYDMSPTTYRKYYKSFLNIKPKR